MDIELYRHNKEAYENVLEHLKKSNKTCVIHPTGTGKSFISLKFLFDNRDKKCLFMAPTEAILEQIKTHIKDSGLTLDDFPNLEFCLYASADKIKENKYDYIVFDEFHRIGADVWGSNVNKLLDNNKDAKVLGVSATPIRYLDDNRDMSKEIFNGDIASHLTLAEAIVKRILPTPNYIGSIISLQNDIDKIQKQIDNYVNKKEREEYQKILDKAKNMLENSDGLDEIFNKNIQNKNGKFIVFCKNYDHMIEMEEKCKEWFKKVNPNIEISDVYATRGKEINKTSIKTFEENNNDSLKLLFSIEMLNEGLHVKDIDGVIMFRPTESPIIYLQQLGRALSVGHNKHPLVFDIVNNFSSLDYIRNLKIEVEKLINDILIENPNYEDADELYEILDTFNIIEQNQNIIRILERLENETFFSWNSWYELAKTYYEHHGNLLVPSKFKTLNGYEYDENGVNLGSWISNMRILKKGSGEYSLSNEKIKKLEDIQMIWDTYEEQWMKMYNLAKEYYNYHGNLNIKSTFKTLNGYEYDENGESLGDWLSKQRCLFKGYRKRKMPDDKIELLNEIGMIWDYMECRWMKMYNLAKEYYKHHGNLDVVISFKTINGYEYDENGVNLGHWISNQKCRFKGYKKHKMPDEKIKLLNEIGMIWYSSEYKWTKMYALAKAYYEHYGNLDVPVDFKTINGYEYDENGEALGSWINIKRSAYNGKKKNKLTDEQKELLNEIGMVWNYSEYKWMKMYNLAKEYHKHYGNLEIPVKFKTINGYEYDENGENLGRWLSRQRCLNKSSKNNEEKIELLNKLGIKWDIYEEQWMKMYNLAKEYYNKYGNLDIPKRFKTINGYDYDENGLKLGSWIICQRRGYRGTSRLKLTENQIKLLNELGIKWDINEEQWMKMYNLAKEYYNYHGNLNINSNFKTTNGYEYDENGENLGYWIYTQKMSYKCKNKGTITTKQIALLEEIAIKWFENYTDNKLQKEEITEKNKLQKQREILNRFYSLLLKYNENELPSKEEINERYIKQLNRE